VYCLILIGVLILSHSLGKECAHLGKFNKPSFNAMDWTAYHAKKRAWQGLMHSTV